MHVWICGINVPSIVLNVTNIVPSVKSSWTCCGQSNGTEVCWWCIWRKHQAYSILMSDPKDAADPAWKGHYCGIHQEWRLQVSMQILLNLYTVCHIPVYTVLCVALLICFFPSRYVRLLGAMYMRLTGTSVDCYKYLEPLYNDYRKVKSQNRNGGGHFLDYLVGMWHDIIYSCWKRHLQITFLLYRVWVDACWWVYRWAASCRANVWHHPP